MNIAYRLIYIYILLIFFVVPAQTQNLFNNGATIYVQNSLLTITGNAINNGDFINSGILNLQQNWINQKNYTPKNDVITLTGGVTQLFQHSNNLLICSTDSLVINSLSNKEFTSGVRINKSLNLISGIVNTYPSQNIVLEKNAKAVGGNNQSFVNGVLYCTGNGLKYYPVGKNGIFAPAETEITNPATGILGIETFTPNPNTIISNGIAKISGNRYWKISKLTNDVFQGKISLSYDTVYTPDELANIIVVENNSLSEIYKSIGNNGIPLNFNGLKSEMDFTGIYFAIAIKGQMFSNILYIPNSFYPNAVSTEDQTLKIYGNSLLPDNFSFKIFNKWGKLVFETTSLQEMQTIGWNGKNTQNELLQGDMYVYLLKGRNINNENIEKTGQIFLIK